MTEKQVVADCIMCIVDLLTSMGRLQFDLDADLFDRLILKAQTDDLGVAGILCRNVPASSPEAHLLLVLGRVCQGLGLRRLAGIFDVECLAVILVMSLHELD